LLNFATGDEVIATFEATHCDGGTARCRNIEVLTSDGRTNLAPEVCAFGWDG